MSGRPGRQDVAPPELLYEPDPAVARDARVQNYLRWLEENKAISFSSWDELQRWSVDDLEAFWESVWQYFEVKEHAPYERVLSGTRMPDVSWFPGALLNYAEHCMGTEEDSGSLAVLAVSQTRGQIELTFGELAEEVRRVRAGLQRLGVQRGDRVVAYLPNIPEALVAFLATASLGAVWSSCAPEFGAHSVVDRFSQVEPKVLLVVAGYTYGEKEIDKRSDVALIRSALPTVEHVVHVPYGDLKFDDSLHSWSELAADTDAQLEFDPVPFEHPLYVLFSSGTTGKPKAIVHGHGGILLEHFKNHQFSWDLGVGDRFLWFTTTAWMMWNALVSGLLVRSAVVLIDGNPLFPDLNHQWRLAQESGATMMGVSPGYLMECRKAGLRPGDEFDLSALRQLGVVGSPLPVEGARWVAEQFGRRIVLNVGSGGTDVCAALVQSSPLQKVWAGEMSGAALGVDVKAFDPDGNRVVGELGELVITSPMPSMPLGIWGDADGKVLHAAYFDTYEGVFRFGDWCRFSDEGSCLITGRSDATLNRGGVRLGTAEFYRVLQDVPEISDSLIVHLEDTQGGLGELILFVVPAPEVAVDAELRRRLADRIRSRLSPRHVPDTIVEVAAVPYSRTGKKLEVPVKRILQGVPPEHAASAGALMDATALNAFVAHRAARSEVTDE